jgi:hypothetical protein
LPPNFGRQLEDDVREGNPVGLPNFICQEVVGNKVRIREVQTPYVHQTTKGIYELEEL